MSITIGIDIGTTYARGAAVDNQGQPYLIPDRYGDVHVPAVVRYTMHGPQVGYYPARFLVTNWENTVRDITRFIGRYSDIPTQVLSAAPFTVYEQGGKACFNLLYDTATPDEVYALVVQHLAAQAEAYLHADVDAAVVTVPANAEDRYRVVVKEAVERAGLRVQRLVNQPTAALLGARGAGVSNLQGNVAVVDAGGGTTDVSIANITGDDVRILATRGDPYLGARDFCNRLAEELARGWSIDLTGTRASRVMQLGIYHAAEEALPRLAKYTQTLVVIEHGAGFGRDLQALVQRADFETWIAPQLTRIAELCQQACRDSQLSGKDIDAVLLVGGASQIPAVQRAIAQAFGRAVDELICHEPLALAAYGAALWGARPGATVRDVTPYPLGIDCYDSNDNYFLSEIIAANAPIPTPADGYTGHYQTRRVDQTEVDLKILQYRGDKRGVRIHPDECELLGEWTFSGLTPEKGKHAPFTVTFMIDESGILHITAHERDKPNILTAQVNKF